MTSAKAPCRRRLSAEARHMLGWCVALAVAAHVLLLAGMAPSPQPPRTGGRPARPAGVPNRTPSVRLVQPGSSPFSAATAAASAAVAMPTAAASAATASSAAVVADASPLAGFASSTHTEAKAAAALASAARSEAGGVAEGPEGGYVPRPLLSVGPTPVVPVVIAAPPPTAAGRLIGRYSGVLALYIDEEGRVRRVEAESPALPEPLERAAREAFLGARFSPGLVAGRVVKSRIRVEVVFDDAPAASAAASAAALAASAPSRAGATASPGASAGATPSAQRSP